MKREMANKALKIDRQERSKHREELGDDWMKRRRPGLAGGNGYDLRVGLGEGSDSARVIMEGRTAIKKNDVRWRGLVERVERMLLALVFVEAEK